MTQEPPGFHEDAEVARSTPGRLEHPTRMLKQGDTLAVLERSGEIGTCSRTLSGIFHGDTRFISRLSLTVDGACLLLVRSAVQEDNALLTVELTNPGVETRQGVGIPRGTIQITRSMVLWEATCHELMQIRNCGRERTAFRLAITLGADFADIFELRGLERRRRGRRLPVQVGEASLAFPYEGVDGRHRCARVRFDPAPHALVASRAAYDVTLEPRGTAAIRLTVGCEAAPGLEAGLRPGSGSGSSSSALTYGAAAKEAVRSLRSARDSEPRLVTSNEGFNAWWDRSLADLHLLQTPTPFGRYPCAGVPWYSTPFGRDGILTALSCLWFWPDLARGVLVFLAATQADEDDPERDARPGKILHETRGGEMASVGDVPFGRYYGAVDTTPLFVLLAGAYHERTGDLAFVESLWPNVDRAIRWIDAYGDVDGDGFVEAAPRSPRGLANQGWKDSQDAVFHSDGSPAAGPVALCEVQGYVFAATRAAAVLCRLLGRDERARELAARAEALRARFEAGYWCADLSTYALALDAGKRPCRVRTSNPGHCLFTGIAGEERARRLAATLTAGPSYSGWGIRTVASTEAAYDPTSYHNGSVWPHDNALIAAGLGRYGFRAEAGLILGGLLDASAHFELHRLPELFCGFARQPGQGPAPHPSACSPQAWAAAAPLACLQACIGLEVVGSASRVVFSKPRLPPFFDEIRIQGLGAGTGTVDLLLSRHGEGADLRVLRRTGGVEVRVRK